MFRALRHPNFRLFFAGQAVSLIGTWMQMVGQNWLVYDLTKSSFWLGVIGFLGSLPILLFSLFGGAVADRVPKRPLIIGFQSVLLTLAFVLGLLTAMGWIALWHVAVLAFLIGLVGAFEIPARQSFLIEMVGKEDLGNAIALNAAMFNSARLIGPALAGPLIDWAGTASCFFFNSASFLAVLLGLLLMKVPPSQRPARTGSVFESTLDGLRYMRQNPPVLALVAMVGMVTIFGWSYTVLMPIFADQILHRGARGYATLMSMSGVGAVTAALTLAAITDRVRPRRLAFTGLGIFCVAVTAMALSKWYWLSAACMVFVGFGHVMFFATSNTTLQRRVPDEMRGRVMGIYAFVFMGFFPLGSLQAGLVAHWVDARFAVIFGAAVCAVAAVVVSRLVPPVAPPGQTVTPPVTAA